MAESSQILVRRGATVTLTDSSGTPKTYTGRYDGTIRITRGGHDLVRGRDTSGNFLGIPRQGQQSGPSSLELDGMVYGAGGNTTDGSLMDVLSETFPITGLTSAGVSGEDFVWAKVEITTPNVTVGATAKKGSVVRLDNVVITTSSVDFGMDGIRASFTLESNDAYPTITENA